MKLRRDRALNWFNAAQFSDYWYVDPSPMQKEFHISSLIVHGSPEMLPGISLAIAELPGAEVHASDGVGKLVVTLETVSGAEISERIDAIRALEGVFAASLVYHQVEDAGAEEAESVS